MPTLRGWAALGAAFALRSAVDRLRRDPAAGRGDLPFRLGDRRSPLRPQQRTASPAHAPDRTHSGTRRGKSHSRAVADLQQATLRSHRRRRGTQSRHRLLRRGAGRRARANDRPLRGLVQTARGVQGGARRCSGCATRWRSPNPSAPDAAPIASSSIPQVEDLGGLPIVRGQDPNVNTARANFSHSWRRRLLHSPRVSAG